MEREGASGIQPVLLKHAAEAQGTEEARRPLPGPEQLAGLLKK